jgi:predicted phage replisome organizer
MSEVKWIKITTDIFNDEKMMLIESMPDSDSIIVIWFKLLSLAGKSNNGGLVMMSDKVPYTKDMLPILFRRKPTVVELALHTFVQFGMIEILDNDTILVSNWEKHQNVKGLDSIREQNKIRQQRYRDNKKILLENKEQDNKDIDKEGNATNNVTHKPKKDVVVYFDNTELDNLFKDFLKQRKSPKVKDYQ